MAEHFKRLYYLKKIAPDFRKIAYYIPFRKRLIRISKTVCGFLDEILRVPDEILKRTISVKGYKGMPLSVEILQLKNQKGRRPGLFYIHGGGFGYRSAPYHKKLIYRYVKETGCIAILPDYHLLPEHPFPAAYEDVISVYRWMCKNAGKLSMDLEHIVVGGDSAGGALAANLCNSVEKRGLPLPCFQLLIYPVTDARMKTESMKEYTSTPLWNSMNNKKMWEMYLKDSGPAQRKQASPMQNILPKRIPDTYIETAEYDCLRDEGVLYAEKLRKAGAHVELLETKGTIHGYDMAMDSDVTKYSIKRRIDVMKKAMTSKEKR